MALGKSKQFQALKGIKYSWRQLTDVDLQILLKESEIGVTLVDICEDGKSYRLELNSQSTQFDLSHSLIGDKFIELLMTSMYAEKLKKPEKVEKVERHLLHKSDCERISHTTRT